MENKLEARTIPKNEDGMPSRRSFLKGVALGVASAAILSPGTAAIRIMAGLPEDYEQPSSRGRLRGEYCPEPGGTPQGMSCGNPGELPEGGVCGRPGGQVGPGACSPHGTGPTS